MATVVVSDPIAKEAIEELSKRYHVAITFGEHPDSYEPNDVVAIINRWFVVTREWMQRHPNLKIVAHHGAGVDTLIDLEGAKDLGVCVANAPGRNALAVAELTVTLMLALCKKLIPVVNKYPADGAGVRFTMKYTELSGKTLGLVGMGNIGKIVSSIASKGFGMKVIAYDPFVKNSIDGVEITSDRMKVFREADFVSLHLPLTDETRHSVGQAEFAAMKPTAFLLNCARGGIVNQPELIQALKDGVIAGAGLDVTDPEECPADSPLFTMDNVILTPHYAASTEEALYRVGMTCVENIDAAMKGEKIPYRIV